MQQTKQCLTCKNEKPISSFHKAKGHKLDVSENCKDCRKITTKNYYAKNREKLIKKQKLYYSTHQITPEQRAKKRACCRRFYNKNKIEICAHHKQQRIKHPEKAKEYRKRNHKHNIDYNKEFRRKKVIHSSHGRSWWNLNKRTYPNNNECEVCGKPHKLGYHHWDDSNPNKGIWVCISCHNMCERMDDNLEGVYHILKKLVECEAKTTLDYYSNFYFKPTTVRD